MEKKIKDQESVLRRIKRFFRGSPSDWRNLAHRSILTNSSDDRFPSNQISTSKYTLITFIPLNLYEQFSKVANIYFLVCGLLQTIPAISTTQGIPTEYTPLIFILIITALKDMYEDYQRHQSDNVENTRKVFKGQMQSRFKSTFKATEVIQFSNSPLKPQNISQIKIIDDFDDSVQADLKWVDCDAKQLKVGNIIKLVKNDQIPADLIILKSSFPKGQCYVETSQLDGESNLKTKLTPQSLVSTFMTEQSCFDIQYKIELEGPNPYLYKFNGSWIQDESEEQYVTLIIINSKNRISLDASNLLLKGCVLKNTQYIIGLVVYTGHQTKIMLNSHIPRGKMTNLQKTMNRLIITLWFSQMLLCVFCSIYGSFWVGINYDYIPYLQHDEISLSLSRYLQFFITRLGNWFILFINFVPISMMITLEMISLFQTYFIINDKLMAFKGIKPTVQTSNLNDDLGQITNIFSDKTGTLTCNRMDFRCLWINGIHYGHEYLNPMRGRLISSISKKQSINDFDDDEPSKEYKIYSKDDNQSGEQEIHSQYSPIIKQEVQNVNFQDENYYKILKDKSNEQLSQSLILLALCNDVMIETNQEDMTAQRQYNASSPDELALVNFAKFSGVELVSKTFDGKITIKINEDFQTYQLLKVLEFDSNRKRMSVIVSKQDGGILLLCKGADSVIIPRLYENPKIDDLVQSLLSYSMRGLRTLVLASKEIDIQEYQQWDREYQIACNQVSDRDVFMAKVMDQIEQDLRLIGVSAIEDKLQQDVADTVRSLQLANIIIWIITGDKKETALNIGFASSIVNLNDQIIQLDLDLTQDVQQNRSKSSKLKFSVPNLNQKTLSYQDLELIKQQVQISFQSKTPEQILDLALHQLNQAENQILLLKSNSDRSDKLNACLILTGDFLLKMNTVELRQRLIYIAQACNSVIACRVSPKQKREIVEMFKHFYPDKRTLAIGDGANDVNMITEAHVGIGIQGLEGTQAARSSDYAVPQFKCLKRLLLFHGREFYRKNSKVVLYNFYKNMLYLMPQFWFGFANGFSGTPLYDLFVFQCYNFMFTSLPIIVYGVFDLKFNNAKDQSNPVNYLIGHRNGHLNLQLFWIWIIQGLYQSCIIFYFTFYILNSSVSSGRTDDFVLQGFLKKYRIGQIIFYLAIIIANGQIFIMQNTIPLIQCVTMIMSFGSYYIIMLSTSFFVNYMLYQIWEEMHIQIQFYLLLLIATSAALMIQVSQSRYQFMAHRGYYLQNIKDFVLHYKYSQKIQKPTYISRRKQQRAHLIVNAMKKYNKLQIKMHSNILCYENSLNEYARKIVNLQALLSESYIQKDFFNLEIKSIVFSYRQPEFEFSSLCLDQAHSMQKEIKDLRDHNDLLQKKITNQKEIKVELEQLCKKRESQVMKIIIIVVPKNWLTNIRRGRKKFNLSKQVEGLNQISKRITKYITNLSTKQLQQEKDETTTQSRNCSISTFDDLHHPLKSRNKLSHQTSLDDTLINYNKKNVKSSIFIQKASGNEQFKSEL